MGQSLRREMDALYIQAARYLEARNHAECLNTLSRIRYVLPNYPDPKGLDRQARKEWCNALYMRAVVAFVRDRYQEVLDLWTQIQGIDPHYPDRLNLIRRASNKTDKGAWLVILGRWGWRALRGLAVIVVVLLLALLSWRALQFARERTAVARQATAALQTMTAAVGQTRTALTATSAMAAVATSDAASTATSAAASTATSAAVPPAATPTSVPTPAAMPTLTGTTVPTPTPTVTFTPTPSPTPTVTPTPTPLPTLAYTPAPDQIHIVQPGDWLSTIADGAYNSAYAYRAIYHFTNRRCLETDSAFNCIEHPDLIEIGWIIYLPTPEEVEAYWLGQFSRLPACSPSRVAGDIVVVGSSAVYPLTLRMADLFVQDGFEDQIDVSNVGAPEGLEMLCAGEADALNASYRIEEEEWVEGGCEGLEAVELQVGEDASVVVVSADTPFIDPAEPITPAELRQILSTAETWSDVRSEWPDESIERFYPAEASDTFAFFADRLFGGDEEALSGAANTVQVDDVEALLESIAENAYAVGFSGYAQYRDHRTTLQALPVDGVLPLQETVDTGTYPLTRPLYVYTTAEVIQREPQVAMFLSCYLKALKDEIIDVGYYLPSEELFRRSVQKLIDAMEQ